MKQYLAGIGLLLLAGTICWGQGSKDSFVATKSKMELEIMSGILKTTLTFVDQSSQSQPSRWRFSDLNAFHLANQGAVFVIYAPGYGGIDTRGLSFNLGPEFSEQMEALNREISAYSREVAADAARIAREVDALSRGLSGAESGQGGNAAAARPLPPLPPLPPSPPSSAENPEKSKQAAKQEIQREELRKRLEELSAKAKQSRKEDEASRQESLQTLSEVKNHLVETLANYGDSLTTVKPDEYVNLVLVTDDFDAHGKRSEVISAKKSWITDYKAGRLTLEAFRQKAAQSAE